MRKYQIAHIHEQGQDMVIVPLDSAFERSTEAQRNATIANLEACSASAGLRGTVVVVWAVGQTTKFIAPRPWHPFFSARNVNDFVRMCNKELTCG